MFALPSRVPSHEIRAHLLDLLGNQAELRDPLRIKLAFVAEGHRLEREDCFACPIHRLDRLLETGRGDDRAELPVRTDDNLYAAGGDGPANAGDVGRTLCSHVANADGEGLARNPRRADIDIVIAGGEILTGECAQSDVVLAGRVARKRAIAKSYVRAAACVALQRPLTDGRVEAPHGVVLERFIAGRGVVAARRVVPQRMAAASRVGAAGGVVKQRVQAVGRVEAAGGVAEQHDASVSPSTLPPILYQLGTNPPSAELTQTLMVSSTNASVNFSVSTTTGATWLNIAPSSSATGTSGQAVAVRLTVNANGLAVGSYITQVLVSVVNGASLAPITVQLVVTSNPPLSLSQNTLSFNSQFGGGSPPPGQAVQVATLNGSGAVPFTYSSDSSWLTASAPSFNTPVMLTVNVNPASLAVGTYHGNITVTPNNSDGNLYSLAIAVTLTVGNSSQLTAAPSLLVFSFETSQGAPAAQVIQIQSIGQPTSFNISTSTATVANCPVNWLQAASLGSTLASTPADVTVTANVAGMTAGTCTGTVTISYPAGSLSPTNLSIPVTMNVSASPLLTISFPRGFGVLTVPANGNITSPPITLTSTDPSTQVTFFASATSSGPSAWLSVGSNGFQTPQQLTPQIAANLLPPNTYSGTITITSNNLPSGAVTIPITLIVTPSITVTVAPQTLTFNQALGGPLPVSQSVTLTSSASGANFQVSVPNTAQCGWLQVTPTSGSATGAVTFAVQQNTLPQNTYACQVTLSFGSAATQSAFVTATLVVGPSQTLTAAPTSFPFNYQLTGPTPAAQPLVLSSTGGPVNFTATASSTGNWLTIDTTSGATPKTINVSVSPQNIPAGTAGGSVLNGTITITAPGVLTTPLTLAVTLTITAAPIPQPATIINSATSGFGSVAPGELIAIKGTGLGPTTPASFTVTAQGTVSSTLGSVQVLFDGIPGTPTYVSAAQINVTVPYEIAGRTSTNVVVVYNGVQSAPIPQQVGQVAPGMFTMNATGSGQASAGNQNFSTNGPPGGVNIGGVLVPTTPAAQGSVVAVYMTGGGQTTPASITGSVNPLQQLPLVGWTPTSGTVTAKIGGVPANVTYAGGAPGLIAGVIQVNVQIPTGVSGNALPIVITINGISSTATGAVPTIAVQ